MTAHAALIRFAACAVFLLGGACRRADNGAPTVVFRTDESAADYGVIDVEHVDARGLATLARRDISDAEWQQIFSVHVNDSTGLPVLGDYIVKGSTLRFKPLYKPLSGTTYIARFDATAFNTKAGVHAKPGDARGTWELLPDTRPSTTSVQAVYPSSDSLPMNLLRLYIQFSAPMSINDGAEHRVHLLDEQGGDVKNAFLAAAGGQELWDRAHTRLTLFFDPGRIKRDLKPHDALGLPLQQGHRYRLVIDSGWHDASGRAVQRGFEKHFQVGPIDRVLPRTTNWRVTAPKWNTREPLVVTVPEPLDHALLSRMLVVMRGGNVVPGEVRLDERETRWTFSPAVAWQGGNYAITVDTELEDLAGNNLKRLFDVMPGDSASHGVSGATVLVPFRLRSQ